MNSLNSVLMEGQAYQVKEDGSFLIVCVHRKSEANIVMPCLLESKKVKIKNKDKLRVIGSIVMKNNKLTLSVETVEYKAAIHDVPYSQLKEKLDKILEE